MALMSSSSPAVRRVAAMSVDALIILESFVVALLFRFDGSVPEGFWDSFWPFGALSAVVFVVLLFEGGVYRNVLRYTGVYQGVRVASATALATGVLILANLGIDLVWSRPVPLSVILVGGVLGYMQLVAVRLYPRVFYERSLREIGQRDRALIVGAGDEGVALARQLWRTPEADLEPVGFIAADARAIARLRGEQIEGVSVLGGVEDIEEIAEEHGIDQILIALPTASSEEIDLIWRECVKTRAEVKVVPKLSEFLGRGAVPLRELQIQDLLGRQPVQIDLDALAEFINGKRVLVTGAGGSIGSELSRQISRLGPARLVLLDRDESALYYLNEELSREGSAVNIQIVVGDVTNSEKVRALFTRIRPQLVFHAAAYKHVPLMELHASEAVSNNVGGTLSVARAAGEFGVEKFINVSTDKAVNPVNVMGATKRLSEMIVRSTAEEYPETLYASVRFGNVLGSRGSVVPTFQRQIEAGGPVTVTHPEMTRYFMITSEAVSLILQTSAMADRYGVYLLEMGRPVKIVDLATQMIQIMGNQGVRIKYVGLRPGEKLHETLSEESEHRAETAHPMVFRLVPKNPPSSDLLEVAEEMAYLAREGDDEKALKLLRRAVPNYPVVESGALPEAL